MKKYLFLLGLLFSVTALPAQQSIQSHNVHGFTAINLTGNLFVELIPAESNSIDIVLTDSDLNKLKWEVDAGVLSVTLRPTQGRGVKAKADVKIYYCPSTSPLNRISLTEGELYVSEPLQSPMLNITLTGGAKISAAIDAFDLEADVSGNSVASLSGEAKYLTLRATEKSKVDTRKLDSVSATVDAATGAEIFVRASERLAANAKSAAAIYYMGEPTILKSKANGGMGASVHNIDY